MGYFSNGSEGDNYRAQFCENCVHDIHRDCPVWLAHILYNYTDCDNESSILHLLIPRSPDALHNEQCKLFLPIT